MAVSTTGVASYAALELETLTGIRQDGGTGSAAQVINAMIRAGDKALTQSPQAADRIVTSGDAAKSGETANTGLVGKQGGYTWDLAQAYSVTGENQYLSKAKDFLLDWAATNTPDGDAVANAGLLKMVRAYDLIRDHFTSSEINTIDNWMKDIADAVIAEQADALARGSMTAANNHRSHALLEVGAIGAALGDAHYIGYTTDNFLPHVGANLRSFEGEPQNLGIDYHERQAYHYVAYNLEALGQLAVIIDRLGDVAGNPYGIGYDPFIVEVNGASIARTMSALLPYAAGDRVSNSEYEGSLNANDAVRIESGALSTSFDPTDAIEALTAAGYFQSATGGHDLASVVADILRDDGKLTLPADMPSTEFLLNAVHRTLAGNSPAASGDTAGAAAPVSVTEADSAPVMPGDVEATDMLQGMQLNVIEGDNGANRLNGSSNADEIFGHRGNDVIRGNGGDDHIWGGTGSDTISGGTGDDMLQGEAGGDKFNFNLRTGHDVIADFESVDRIFIASQIYATKSELLDHITYNGNDAVIQLDGDNTLTVAGVEDYRLTSGDFTIFTG
jgi:Ca2+-binding RTX toxin-like protein